MPQFNSDSEFEEVWQDESWTAHSGGHFQEDIHIYTDWCEYVDGIHVYGGRHCPHYNGVDEFATEPGWTVLDNRKGNK